MTCKLPGGAFYAWPNVTEACRITGCADSEAFRKRLLAEAGVAVLADIHFGRRVPATASTSAFPTPRRRTRSAKASRGWTRSSAGTAGGCHGRRERETA